MAVFTKPETSQTLSSGFGDLRPAFLVANKVPTVPAQKADDSFLGGSQASG